MDALSIVASIGGLLWAVSTYIYTRTVKRIDHLVTSMEKQGRAILRMSSTQKVLAQSAKRTHNDIEDIEEVCSELKQVTGELRIKSAEHDRFHKQNRRRDDRSGSSSFVGE